MITDTQLNGIASEIAREEERWLAFWMGTLVPSVVMRWVKERKNLAAVAGYLERKNIRIVIKVGDTRKTLMHGNRLVATFDVRTSRRGAL